MRRKGELSAGRRDREWPHQIVKKAVDCRTSNYDAIHKFCEKLSLCPKGASFVEADEWMQVFCFSTKEDAEKFQAEFGGEWFDPSRKRRGAGWAKLKEPKQKFY